MLFSSCKDVKFDVPKGDIRKVCVTPANIPDPALWQAIRNRIGTDPSGYICAELLPCIESLSINSQVNDFTGLELLTNLKQLYLGYNSQSDISFLSKVPGLTSLIISYGNLLSTAGLAYVPGLKQLVMQDNPSVAFSEINLLINLEDLQINGGNFSNADMPMLAALSKLKYLHLDNNTTLSDLSAISGLLNLETLSATNCQITALTQISGLVKLRRINFSGNDLTSLGGVSGLSTLLELYAGSNNITDISAITGLTSLEALGLSGNNLTTIAEISNLLSLHWLDVSDNSITSIYPLYRNHDNGGFGDGDIAYLSNNPLNANPDMDTYIPHLINAGAEIFY